MSNGKRGPGDGTRVPCHVQTFIGVFYDDIVTLWSTTAIVINIPGTCFETDTSRQRLNGRHFPDDIFKVILFYANFCILITISLKYVSHGPINNIPSLIQIMAWRRSGGKQLFESMVVRLPTHICVTRPQWVKDVLCMLCFPSVHSPHQFGENKVD